MTIGKFGIGKRWNTTKDFKWFYCPLTKGIREHYRFFWWFGHSWYICLGK